MVPISVVVPVYNTARFLAGCLDSIMNQTFPEWELILVDDGSTDDSADICDSYALKDKRIKVIHKKNAGQQAAVQDGFSITQGQWLCFVDSDDTLPENALHTLYSATTGTDIVVGFSFPGDGSCNAVPIHEWRVSILKSSPILCTRWGKLFRRTLFNPSTFDCPDHLRVGEDMIMNIKVAFATKRPVTLLHTCVYNYNRNNGSVSSTWRWDPERFGLLYQTVRNAVPPDALHPDYHSAIIDNGMQMVRQTILKGSREDRNILSSSTLVRQLIADIHSWGHRTTCRERMLLSRSSSILTRHFFIGERALEICRQFVRRHIWGK